MGAGTRKATVCFTLATTLALWPIIIFFNGQYTIVKRPDAQADSIDIVKIERRYDSGNEIMKARLKVFSEAKSITEETADDRESLVGNVGLQVELKRALSVNQSSPRAAFETVVALSSLLPRVRNISRIKTPTPEAFLSYIAPVGLPVIFTDMLEGTRLADWSWDMLRTKYGHQVFHNTRQGNYSTKKTSYGKQVIGRTSVTLADFIDVATGKRQPKKGEQGLYITKQRVIPKEALEEEFYYPPFYPGSHKQCYLEPTAWIGVPGTFTQGHIDSKDNFAYQILGDKRWTIFSPQDYEYLYYTKTKGSLEWSSALNSLKEPDLKKFPLYAKANPIKFVLHAGEVLYLPRGWTHFVENITPALMINTWRYGPAAITELWSERNKAEIHRRCF